MFSGSREHAGACAVFDIGSASAGCAIVERNDGKATIIECDRITLPLEERTHAAAFSAVKQALSDAGKRVAGAYLAKGTRHIVHAHAIIRAPWTSIAIARSGMSLPAPARIGQAELTQLAKEALRNHRVARTDFLEAATMRVYLNGYPTDAPEGKRAHRADMVALIALCDPSVREALTSAIGAFSPPERLSLHAGARCVYEALRNATNFPDECLVLDVGIEGTDALIVRGGAIELEAYIEEGTRSILSRISGSAADQTLSLLRMVARDECAAEECAKFEESLARVEPELAHVFGEAFAQLSAPARLPDTIVLLAHPDLAAWLQKFFARIDFTQFTTTTQPFEVSAVSAEALAPLVSVAQGVSADVDMRVSAAVVNNAEHGS